MITMPTLRSRLRRNGVVITLTVVALVGAGCGSGTTSSAKKATPGPGSTSTTVPTSSTAAPTGGSGTTPTTTAGPESAKAAAAVLQPTDFPYGWTPQPFDPTGGLHIERLWRNLTHCLNVDNTTPAPSVATAPTFLRGLATSATSSVEYTTPASATAIADALGGAKLQGCLTSAFNANAQLSHPQGAVPGPATVSVLAPPQVGDKAFAFRVNVTMSLSGLQIKLFHDFVVAFKGGTVIRMWFLNPGSGFPPDLEQTLLQNVVGRA